ncbi:hypothetical protein PMAYCL1PPCAC_21451, partial [Pristionchus mayeri]
TFDINTIHLEQMRTAVILLIAMLVINAMPLDNVQNQTVQLHDDVKIPHQRSTTSRPYTPRIETHTGSRNGGTHGGVRVGFPFGRR